MLIETEELWDEVRERCVARARRALRTARRPTMMGMSSPEWSRYMHEVIGVPEPPEEISAEVVWRMEARYRERLPLIPGARRRSSGWPHAGRSASRRRRTAR